MEFVKTVTYAVQPALFFGFPNYWSSVVNEIQFNAPAYLHDWVLAHILAGCVVSTSKLRELVREDEYNTIKAHTAPCVPS